MSNSKESSLSVIIGLQLLAAGIVTGILGVQHVWNDIVPQWLDVHHKMSFWNAFWFITLMHFCFHRGAHEHAKLTVAQSGTFSLLNSALLWLFIWSVT